MKTGIRNLVVAAVGVLTAVAFAGVVIPAQVGAQPAAACSTTPTNGTERRDIDDRPYNLFVPEGISGSAPLIVALHGGRSNPNTIETQMGWTEFAKTNKVIVAYPRGSKKEGLEHEDFWAWEFARNTGPDVPFLREVITEISGTYCVARDRVHVAGHSNGGQMTTRIVCEADDLIASAAVWAGPKGAWDLADCPTTRPVAFGVMLNDNDPFIMQVVAEQHRDHWREKNNCGAEQSESGPGVLRGQRFPCAAGTEVVYRLYDGPDNPWLAHDWPTGARGADVRNRMWQLFDANRHPSQ
ncbi:CE1 family esterase [Nocardia puris]|uniref:alpha/beta hydrolase family esterase n=1 Tax=Nocardia puris TaxID=208602 RepID=UPI000837210A|nr:PHB depolymerase family esterase [Nocardia puris]